MRAGYVGPESMGIVEGKKLFLLRRNDEYGHLNDWEGWILMRPPINPLPYFSFGLGFPRTGKTLDLGKK